MFSVNRLFRDFSKAKVSRNIQRKCAKMSHSKSSIGGIVFVGCMFLGGGIGSLLGEPHSGWLIGLGAGFIGMALTRVWMK
jgi:hypothetical protein